MCGFAFQCAALFRATVLAHEKWPLRASLRPLDIYIYAFGSQSCTTRLPLLRSARQDPDRDRAWHLWSSSSREECPRLRTPLATAFGGSLRSGDTPFHTAMLTCLSLAIRVVMLRRRNTGSLPHSRLSAQSANRIPACHSAQRSVTLPASSLHVKPLQATQQPLIDSIAADK